MFGLHKFLKLWFHMTELKESNRVSIFQSPTLDYFPLHDAGRRGEWNHVLLLPVICHYLIIRWHGVENIVDLTHT